MSLCKIQLPVTFIKPGETCYTDEPALIMTSLRSSIAIMMFNKRLHFAGICHVRPVFCTGHCDEAFIHMDCATKQMLGIFDFLGIKRNEISLSVFGVADVTAFPDIDIFRTSLRTEGLHFADCHVGKTFTRKILFFTHTGEVFTKQIRENNLPQEE